MKPKVTIGVCARNCEGSIKDAINSIMTQDFPHDRVKLIFIDDGSEDQTLNIIRESIDKMDISNIVIHTPWKGLGNARNLVIKNAIGNYILWVDGDMTISPDFLRRLVEFMENNPKAGIAKGKNALMYEGNLLATLEANSRRLGRMTDYQSKKGLSKAVGTGGALYRIKAVTQVGGFDNSLRGYNEDWDLELRLRKAGWLFYTIDVTFYDYERYGLTWKSLWCRYWLRGYFTHHFLHKNKGMIKHYRMFPPAASISGLLGSFTLFRLTKKKSSFLLTFQFIFKMTAWYVGFLRSHFDYYAPRT